jgi:hypothetical protein
MPGAAWTAESGSAEPVRPAAIPVLPAPAEGIHDRRYYALRGPELPGLISTSANASAYTGLEAGSAVQCPREGQWDQ